MSATPREYTATEAAAVSGIGVKSVHNAIDKQIIAGRHSSENGRAITDDDLLRLKLWYGIGSILSAERRKKLFDAIAENPDAKTVRADDYLIVDIERAKQQLAARADALREVENLVHSQKGLVGGEPVFKGTRIPVRSIGAMRIQGASVEEIVDGYPSLNLRMVELAELWSIAHPARGRPKRLSEQGLTAISTKRPFLKSEGSPNRSDRAG